MPAVLTALILSAALLGQDAAADQATDSQSPPPQTPPVSVDAYHGNYEAPKTGQELNYDSGIWSAYNAKENQVGNLEGSWVVTTADGRKLVGLELRSNNLVSGRLEGAWRSLLAGFGVNNSGFVSDVDLTGRDLEINYFAGKARSPTILMMHKDGDGLWRGNLLDTTGHKTAIVMSTVRAGT